MCGMVAIVQINIMGSFANTSYTQVASLPEEIANRLIMPTSGQYSAVCGYNTVSGALESVVCFVSRSGDISVRPAATTNSVFGSFVIMLA